MANTYHQLGVHFVTAVKHRQSLIDRSWLPEIYAVSTTIIQNRKHNMIAIGGEPDHLHLFVDMDPTDAVADLAGAWKAQVSGFISRRFSIDFEFQRGYGAFSVGKRDWTTVKYYVNHQYEHHNKQTFEKEYLQMLRENEVAYDPKYLFMWHELPSEGAA